MIHGPLMQVPSRGRICLVRSLYPTWASNPTALPNTCLWPALMLEKLLYSHYVIKPRKNEAVSDIFTTSKPRPGRWRWREAQTPINSLLVLQIAQIQGTAYYSFYCDLEALLTSFLLTVQWKRTVRILCQVQHTVRLRRGVR